MSTPNFKLLIGILLLFCFQMSFAGDTPCGATSVNTNMSDFQTYSNLGNSDSGIPAAPYGNYLGSDFWFSFVAPASGTVYITLGNIVLQDMVVGVYDGACENPRLIYNVLDHNCDGSDAPQMELNELMPGETYYLRVWSETNTNGDFQIYIVETNTLINNYIPFQDATIDGLCVTLTTEGPYQNGCAWYQDIIDFTQPFSHSINMFFGNNDSGADGICLVYQSNGPSICGSAGGGMGAEGMPNSAIFEFDTYQNQSVSDPFEDHTAFNVNGNLDHQANIQGPVTLGNIEDGAYHEVTFTWDPNGNIYELFFDGTVVLSGSYDIVTNCFGGVPSAYWGFTAATGGQNNLHRICPLDELVEYGTQSYEFVELCEGESHNGYTESGFFVDFESMDNGCMHQNNTEIVVHNNGEFFIDSLICYGDAVSVLGQSFDQTGSYELFAETIHGCDSVINLELEVVELEGEISQNEILGCDDEPVILTFDLNSNFPYEEASYTWVGNEQIFSGNPIAVNEAGIYVVTCMVEFENGVICSFTETYEVEVNNDIPSIDGLENISIDCNSQSEDIYLVVLTEDGNLIEWTLNGELIGTNDSLLVTIPGIYKVDVINPENGCSNFFFVDVEVDASLPTVDLSGENLDCQTISTDLLAHCDEILDAYIWIFNGDTIAMDSVVTIGENGTYEFYGITEDDCVVSNVITIEQDTLSPSLGLQDSIFNCDVLNGTFFQDKTDDEIMIWTFENEEISDSLSAEINASGVYYVTKVDTTNFCTTVDSFEVNFKGISPKISKQYDNLITCSDPSGTFVLIDTIEGETYTWYKDDVLINTKSTFNYNEGGTYVLEVISSSGCITYDTSVVDENFMLPEPISIDADTFDCGVSNVSVQANIQPNASYSWSGPDNFVGTGDVVNVSLPGKYYVTATDVNSGCIRIDSIQVQSKAQYPTYDLSGGSLSCNNLSALINLEIYDPYQSVSWTGPNNFQNSESIIVVQDTGYYDLHIEVDGNCDVDTTIYIEGDFEKPEFSITFDSITCLNPIANITSDYPSDSDIYIIEPNGNVQNVGSFTTDQFGVFYVTVTGQNGCMEQDSFVIFENTIVPKVDVTKSNDIDCNNQVSQIAAFKNSDYSYTWSRNGFITNNASFSTDEAGTYVLQVETEYGCLFDTTIVVESHLDLPEVDITGNDLTCYNPETELVCSVNDSIDKVTWVVNGINQNGGVTNLVDQPGKYVALVVNEHGCVGVDSIFIESFQEDPNLELLTEEDIEVYEDVQNSFGVKVLSNNAYMLEWMPTNGLSCTDCESPIVLNPESGTYTCIVTDIYGCTAEIDIKVRYIEKNKVFIPNAIHLNNPFNNRFTVFSNKSIKSVNTLKIFDRWGELVFRNDHFPPNDLSQGWNGYFKNDRVLAGVYVYYVEVVDIKGESHAYNGTLTVMH